MPLLISETLNNYCYFFLQISLYLLLAIIAIIFSVTLVAASGVGVMKETHRAGPVHSVSYSLPDIG